MNYEKIRTTQSKSPDTANIMNEKSSSPIKQVEDSAELLQSEKAQNILPYLTLEKLEQREISNLMRLSKDVLADMESGSLPKNKFLTISNLGKAIAIASDEETSWEEHRVSPKLAQARKLVCAYLLDETNDENPKRAWDIHNTFFGQAPDITSSCGGLHSFLELLTIAERANQKPCAEEIYEEIMYQYSFSKQNEFKDILCSSPPVQQLRLLPIYNNIALRCDADDFSKTILDKVTQALDIVENDKHSKPLIRLVTSLVNDNISQQLNADWIDINDDGSEYQTMIKEHKKRHSIWKKEQERLHTIYPNLPRNLPLSIIAPETAGTSDTSGNIVQIANQKGETLSLLNCSKDNAFELDKDAAFLLSAAHNPGVEEIINNKIDLKLNDIPLKSQVQLLKFMTEANPERFDKLCNTLLKTNKELRLKLTESFIATDFGEDFGDALLDIIESKRFDTNEKERLLDTISSCRESVKQITNLYTGFDDGKFAKEYARASNERLTDTITAFQQIAKHGIAEADLGWAGKPRFDFNKAMEALEYEAKSLQIINGTLNDVNTGAKGAFAEIVMHPDSSNQRLNRTMYNFYSPNYGYVLLYTRPEGSHSFDPMIDYGKHRSRYDVNSVNAGTEASISLITNPVDPYSLPSPFRPDKNAVKNPQFYNPTTMDKVSAIRLDREGRAPGDTADDSSRDPVNQVGMVSVDLAAIGDRDDTPSGKIARLLSVGGRLREETSGVNSSLNHNTRWFDQNTYGTSDGFRQLVEFIDKTALKWCEESKPGKDAPDNFTEIKAQLAKIERAKNRKRGHKAL